MEPEQVKRRYYAIVGLYNLSASLIWGVNTLFLLDAGLSLFQTFVATAFFTAGQVLFEIPTGVVADTVGRRISFLASLATLFVGTLAYVWLAETGGGLLLFAAASIILGLGFTFYSGAVEAWVVDALDAVGDIGRKDGVFARGGQFQSLAMLVGTVGGGALGQLDLSLPYLVRAGLLAALFILAFIAMKDIGFEQRAFKVKQIPAEMARITRESIDNGWRRPPVRVLLLMSMLLWGYFIWGWYAWQPYFLELLGQPLIWVAGVIAALVSIMGILGNQFATTIGAKSRRSTLLALAAAGIASGLLVTGLVQHFWIAVPAFLAAMFAFGIFGPVHTGALHHCISGKTRATVVSFGGLLGSAAGIVSQIGLGYWTDDVGIAWGYVVGAGAMALLIPLALRLRKWPDADGVA